MVGGGGREEGSREAAEMVGGRRGVGRRLKWWEGGGE